MPRDRSSSQKSASATLPGDLPGMVVKKDLSEKAGQPMVEELLTRIADREAELARAQDRLVQSAKLASVGELAAGVAHELNNPLTGILGYTQWILMEANRCAEGGIPPEGMEPVRERMEKIEREVLRCKEIVQNLLNFSRAEESGTPMKRLDVNSVIEATLGVTGHQLALTQVRVRRTLDSDLPAIDGNANQLQQVFTNILINASKAMPGGGVIEVATGHSPDFVTASFRDSGMGMPATVRDRIFEPFFTTRPVGEGTGLGLSISSALIKAHGGQIVVDSEEGKGTTFFVRLPVPA